MKSRLLINVMIMTMKAKYFGLATLIFGLVLAGSSLAGHKDYLGYIQQQAQGDRSDCSGSHCSVIATYFFDTPNERQKNDTTGIHVTMSMDTLLDPFNITGLTEPAPHDAPATFEIPIDASGEIVGHAVAFYDSPPIFFEANGQVRAVTDGLRTCRSKKRDAGSNNPIFCQDGGFGNPGVGDIIGNWTDTWQVKDSNGAVVSDVGCQTSTSGAVADCTATASASGSYVLELSRQVSDMRVAGEHASLSADRIFPVTMVDRVTLDFGEIEQNQAPVAEAGVRINGSGVTNSAVVIQGQAVQLELIASADVDGDGLASRDPDGWNTPMRGMSDGGKCEWNTDLDQGPPFSFDQLITNPTNPSACDVSLGSVTFNDAPGTYTYNVFRMSDSTGELSGTSSISITVFPPSATPTPHPSTTPDPETSASPSPGVPTECSDGVDNDDDGTTDCADNGCWVDPTDSATCNPDDDEERFEFECSDGLDNDGDGKADCADNGCWVDPTNPDSCNPDDDSEQFIPTIDPGPFQETE